MQNAQAHAETAEVVEGRERAQGNAGRQHRDRTPGRAALSGALDRVRQAAKESARRLTARWHQVHASDRLREAYDRLKHDAAPGVAGPTWAADGEPREPHLRDLADRLQRGASQAPPVERVSIPQAAGRQRPIGQPPREANSVQRATVEVLNAMDEAALVGVSSGARPGRNPHHAWDAVTVGREKRRRHWGRDADRRGFDAAMDHAWLVQCVAHRLGDQRVVHQMRKWRKASGRRGIGDRRRKGRLQGAVPAHGWHISLSTRSLPSGPPSGAAGMHREISFSCGTVTMCAADKRCERMPHRRPTLERSVVKQPPHPDLVTGWGV